MLLPPELQPAVDALRALLPVLPAAFTQGMPKVDEGAESTVHLEPATGLVWKLTPPHRDRTTGELTGQLGYGFVPMAQPRAPHLLDWLERHAVNNAHGRVTEAVAAGVLADGTLVTVQPYVTGLRPSLKRPSAAHLARLNLAPGLPAADTALGLSADRPAVFSDLHEHNLMLSDAGPAIIDTTSRWLTPAEFRALPDRVRRGLPPSGTSAET